MNKIVITGDGSHTIYVPELNEHYHSINGAVQESEHIFINNGLEVSKANPLRILEVGFGTGLNAMLSLKSSIGGDRKIFYTAVEKYPLERKYIDMLNHYLYAGEEGKVFYDLLHSSPWEKSVRLNKNFFLRKIHGDIKLLELHEYYDLIYFDAFGPDKQPDMWTEEVFSRIADHTSGKGILVTFSAKGSVKKYLSRCGFKVTLLSGPPGKRHMIRAVKMK